MAMVLGDALGGIDLTKLLKICIVHDLGEALGGDIPAVVQTAGGGKAAQERADLEELTRPLPAARRTEILALWEEYEAAATPEAMLAKGLDKLETLLQHTQGRNPPGFDYAFNLDYGRRHTSAHPLLAEIRAILDEATRSRMEPQRKPG
jgi:putative hydrolase of HD superfamily